MEEILRKNMERLLGEEEGSLNYALKHSPESMGGNAGHWRGYPCMGVNFYFNQNTGEIVYFGNTQAVPQEIRSHAHGTFRMAINFTRKLIEEIIEAKKNGVEIKRLDGTDRRIIGKSAYGNPSDLALRVLEETARRYNVFSSIKE